MLDVFKDGAEAWLQRIRSPLIGSIVLAFVAFNWKAIFFVVFSDQAILTRFAFFDAQTSFKTLACYPISFGLFLGFLTPFLNYFGSLIAKWPTEKLRLLQAQSAHAVMIKKAEFVIEREMKSAEFKEAALRDAEATQAIDEANLSEATREKLDQKVEDLQIESALKNAHHPTLDSDDKAILSFAANSPDGTFITDRNKLSFAIKNDAPKKMEVGQGHRGEKRLEDALSYLEQEGLLVHVSALGNRYEITRLGYEAVDSFTAQ